MMAPEASSEHGSVRVLASRRVRWRKLGGQAVVGFLLGYLVLHPASMVIFHWLDPRTAAGGHGGSAVGWWEPIAHSFHASMLPMGLVFGLMGALITTFYGYFRLTLTFQRDLLAEELRQNEALRAELAAQAARLRRQNEELARLELANRRTTQFMAHDFKTALNCVGGFAGQLLERRQLREDTEVAKALGSIRRQAHRMMGSVTDLLEFARAREGGTPKREPVAVSRLLQEAVGDFSLPAHARQIALGKRHRDCPPVWADPRLLRRVLCNLVSNAIKHNGPGTQVVLDAEVAGSGKEVLFSCRDDGAGIPAEVLPSVFTEFSTSGDTAESSTGLGLAFCKTVVEGHGGRIWCENLSEGTEFLFTIPLKQDRDDGT